MENVVGTGASQEAYSPDTATKKERSSLNRLDDPLQQLGDTTAELLQEAEGSIASHPLSSIGAAFLLGLAIGRLTKRG
jgi:ElaB/YqjD/DUF883 family membrane-anchored ribosome-binding protein